MKFFQNETPNKPDETQMEELEKLTPEQLQELIEAEDDLHEIQADDDIGEPDPEMMP